MVKQIDFIIVVRRIKTLGIIILISMIVIYFFGLIVARSNRIANFDNVNLISLLLLLIFIPSAFIVKKTILKKTDLSNFMSAYFNAHVIPFAIIDFGALFCITTNLFVNEKILFASLAIIISAAAMILIFPKEEDFYKIKTTTETNISSADTN